MNRGWPRNCNRFLEPLAVETKFEAFCRSIPRDPRRTVDFLVFLNQRLQQEINYVIRLEPGVQTPEETLRQRSGSCRDTSWLLVQVLRHLGLAARFASGYLIQLAPDEKPLEGPAGPAADFTDLHAWAEVFLPGAGWVGLDPTSGLLTGEGHLPLACTPDPSSAAPITGIVEDCRVDFSFQHADRPDPRRSSRHPAVHRRAMGPNPASGPGQVEQRLTAGDVRLTMGESRPSFRSTTWTVRNGMRRPSASTSVDCPNS